MRKKENQKFSRKRREKLKKDENRQPESKTAMISVILVASALSISLMARSYALEEVVDADKIFVMDHGKVVMEGTPKEIFSRVDELKSYRLDVPQVTILADELRKRGLDIPKGILRKEELVEAITHLQQ